MGQEKLIVESIFLRVYISTQDLKEVFDSLLVNVIFTK